MSRLSASPIYLLIVAAALAGAALACSLDMSGGGNEPATRRDASLTDTPAEDTAAPTVRITAPSDGAIVPVGRPVHIEVETDRTATGFQLVEGGLVRSVISMPEGQSGPTKAILSWTPAREGRYQLEVFATNRNSTSAPAAIAVQASGTGEATGTSTCTGRVMVTELNFRDGPGTRSAKLGQFEVGETVTGIGRNADSSWYRVQRANSQQVWVINNAQWLRMEGPCGELPVVE